MKRIKVRYALDLWLHSNARFVAVGGGRVGWRDCWRERDGDRRQGRGKVSGHERRWHFHDQRASRRYTARINAGFAMSETPDVVVSGKAQQFDITLKVAIEEQKVTIASDNRELSTEPENNAGAVVLKGDDIEALPDDPDDLASPASVSRSFGWSKRWTDLRRWFHWWSPAATRLDPRSPYQFKPFSAEYDRLGMGRIEILTRPGTDRFRGQASFNFNDESLNARNPFWNRRHARRFKRASMKLRWSPLKRKASFFVDFDKRDTDDAALVVAQVLDANNNIVGFNEAFPIPSRRTSFSQSRLPDQREPHADRALQLFEEHSHNRRRRLSTALRVRHRAKRTRYSAHRNSNHHKKIVNETRFQFEHQRTRRTPTIPFRLSTCRMHSRAVDPQIGQSHTD